MRGQQLVDNALAEAGADGFGPAGAGNDLQNLHKKGGNEVMSGALIPVAHRPKATARSLSSQAVVWYSDYLK
ncbi:hypothetical protein GCM10028824_28570 [Hymenobacter segetis]